MSSIRVSEMRGSTRTLARRAMQKSIEVRTKAGLDLRGPICIYSLCEKLGLSVEITADNVDGVYLKGDSPTILLSSLRPLVRRKYTCAHELGHHTFGHGTVVDECINDYSEEGGFDPQEFVVNAFAGFLLMPIVGVRKAFASRGWQPATATPLQVYTVACSFGVGYETVLGHMAFSLEMMSRSMAASLKKVKLPAIRKQVLGEATTQPLIIADVHYSLTTVDAEVGTLLLLPEGAEASNDVIIPLRKHPSGDLFVANKPGISRVSCPENEWSVFVLIARHEYVGMSEVRHLEVIKESGQ